jgi:hypothetical protein
LWTFLALFLGIACGVVGFLWHGQEKLADKIEATEKQVLTAVTENTVKDMAYRRRQDRRLNKIMWKLGIPPSDDDDK